MDPVVHALRDQLEELDSMLEPLEPDDWLRPSACEGWTVADVVLHLAQSNELAAASARGRLQGEPAGGVWSSSGAHVDEVAAAAVASQRGSSGAEVHERWRRSADDMVQAFTEADPSVRMTWVVGDVAPRTLATTRIAETWIHTGDVAVGLGVDHPPTDRLRHIAHLAHRTVPYSFTREGLAPPGPVAFVLTPPGGGDPWVFGDPGTASTVVRGPALDLCRVAGQRADAADTALVATGPDARDVLALVRTFA